MKMSIETTLQSFDQEHLELVGCHQFRQWQSFVFTKKGNYHVNRNNFHKFINENFNRVWSLNNKKSDLKRSTATYNCDIKAKQVWIPIQQQKTSNTCKHIVIVCRKNIHLHQTKCGSNTLDRHPIFIIVMQNGLKQIKKHWL